MQVLADLVMSMCLLFHPLFGNFLLADFFLIVSLVYIHKVLNSNL
jgi:hypothetical protein